MTFLIVLFQNISSNCLPEKRPNHIGCICLIFHHCEFSNVPSKNLPLRKDIHIDCICLTFLRCAFSNIASNCLPEKMHSHIGCICSTFLYYEFSNESSNRLCKKTQSHILHFTDFFKRRLDSWPFTRLLLSKKTLQKNSGKGKPPPQIRAMPELKSFSSLDVFPKWNDINTNVSIIIIPKYQQHNCWNDRT